MPDTLGTRARRAAAIVAVLACLLLTTAGCALGGSEARARDSLRAFADTSATRVNIVADRLARQTEELGERAALNREKISVATMGIDNAMHPHAMNGLLDMVFQFDLKARSAQQRVDRLRAATTTTTTKPSRPGSLDRFAEELLAVHAQNRDEIWREVGKYLSDREVGGLRQMIDEWYAKNSELNRATVQFAELKQFAGSDPSKALVFSLVDLKNTNEQVDSIVWGAQRLYENSHWQFRRMLFDAIEEFRRPRDEAIAAVAKAVGSERERAVADVAGVVREAGRWVVAAVVLLAVALVVGAALIRSAARSHRPRARDDGGPRGEVLARVDAIERALADPRRRGDDGGGRPIDRPGPPPPASHGARQ